MPPPSTWSIAIAGLAGLGAPGVQPASPAGPSGPRGSCDSEACVEQVGAATAGRSGFPELGIGGAPVIGQPYHLELRQAAAHSQGVLLAALRESPVISALFGTEIYPANPDFVATFVTDGAGKSQPILALDAVDSSLCGLYFIAQAGVVDPTAQGGMSISRAVRTRFGAGGDGPLLAYKPPGTALGDGLHAVEIADLDGDRLPDVAVSGHTLGSNPRPCVRLFVNRGNGRFVQLPSVVVGAWGLSGGQLALADLNGDTLADIVCVYPEAMVILSTGAGNFAPPQPLGIGSMADVEVGDANEDGVPDLLFCDGYSIHVLLGVGDGSFLPVQSFPAGGWNISIALSDLDQDGHVDVVTGHLQVLHGGGDGTFSAPHTLWVSPPGHRPRQGLEVADFDGDGRDDVASLVEVDFTFTEVQVFSGLGAGALSAPRRYPVCPSTDGLDVADIDRDRSVDLIVSGGSAGGLLVLFGHGDGSFQPLVTYESHGRPFDVAVADLDGDLMPDAVMNVIVPGPALEQRVQVYLNGMLP